MAQENIGEKSTIAVKMELYGEIRTEADEKFRSIQDQVEGIIDRYLKRNKMISNIWPDLQIVMVKQNTIRVIDSKERKLYDVILRDNFLFCKQDRSTACTHSAFVWMQAEDLELDKKF